MVPQPDYPPPAAADDSMGYGFWGCAAGLLAGFFGGGLLLFFLSLALAINATVPIAPTAEAAPDLRVTLAETALNQLAQNNAAEGVQLDILPGNQVNMLAHTTVSAFGVAVPVQLKGLFGIQITNQSSLEVRLIEAQVPGFDLPPEVMRDFFNGPLAMVNQNLNGTLRNASAGLGVPLVLTGLGTTDTELWLEARATP